MGRLSGTVESKGRDPVLAEAVEVARVKLLNIASLALAHALSIDRDGYVSMETAKQIGETFAIIGDGRGYGDRMAAIARLCEAERQAEKPKGSMEL